MCYEEIKEILDFIVKPATVFIALANLYFVIKFFNLKNATDEREKERDRKLQLLKTLVLDNGLKHFYNFFDEIESEYSTLLTKTAISDADRKLIEKNVSDKFITLRRKFLDMFLGVDKSLYKDVLEEVDLLQQGLTDALFDGGVNLTHKPKFDQLILTPITNIKTSIIQKLYVYRG